MLKKVLLILFAVFYCGLSNAQIQVTHSDIENILAVGKSWFQTSNDDPQVSMNVGAPGSTAQNWTVPNLSWEDSVITINIDPATTPYSSEFPEATHAQYTVAEFLGYPATFYIYFKVTPTTFSSIGNVLKIEMPGLDTALIEISEDLIFELPLSYGYVRITRDSTDFGSGMWEIETRTISVDAFGTMTFPFGTYATLRATEISEIEVYDNGVLIEEYTETSFSWISPDAGVFEADIDTSGVITGTIPLSRASMIQFVPTSSADDQYLGLPSDFILYQNYPNPFNPSTTISYSIPDAAQVSIKVYNVLGIEVATLVDEFKQSGNHQVEFKAEGLSSGIYFYTLISAGTKQTRKMMLVK